MKKHSVVTLACLATVVLAIGCEPAADTTPTDTRPQAVAESGISADELGLRLAMRDLWADHVWLTRDYINSASAGLADKDVVAERLLKNQDDIGNAVKPYFGEEAGAKLTELLREHIMIATEVVGAARSGNNEALDAANKQWSENADAIADFLSAANPENWPQAEMRSMMQEHLKLTTDEAVARLKGDWQANIQAFDKALDQAMMMADMLSDGVVAKFPDKF
ncbi:MAG: hypothetical protein WD716_09085 [Fimbriimonadaceae bacterium]